MTVLRHIVLISEFYLKSSGGINFWLYICSVFSTYNVLDIDNIINQSPLKATCRCGGTKKEELCQQQ